MARTYPGSMGIPRSLPFDTATDPRKGLYLVDDFLVGAVTTGLIGDARWTLTGTGGTAGYTAVDNHPGVLTLTAATAGFAAGISIPTFPFKVATGGLLYMVCQFRIPTALTNRDIRIGFCDVAPTTTQPDHGVWLEYDAAADADDWRVGSDNGTVDSDTVAATHVSAPAAATWYTVELALSPTGAQVYLNGEMVTEAAIPSITTASLSPFAFVGDGTNGQTLEVDYIAVKAIVDRSGFVTV